MDLEKLLQQKAAALAESKETEAQRQEQEIEAEEAEQAATEAQVEESRIENLRGQVTQFDGDITQTEALLQELTEVHDGAKEGIATYGDKKEQHTEVVQEVQQMFEQYREVLEGEGITSVDDLLVAEGYAEGDKIKAVVESAAQVQAERGVVKEKINERATVKQEARAVLTGDNPEMTLMYNELVEGLQERLDSLGAKRKEVFWQTPEGQEAKHAELVEVVRQKIDQDFPDYNFDKYWERSQGYAPRFDANGLAGEVVGRGLRDQDKVVAVYGEEDLKAVVEEAIQGKIDGALEAQWQKEGNNALYEQTQGDFERLEAQWQEFKSIAPEVIQQGREIKQRLTAYLDSSEGAGIRAKFIEYYGFRKDPSADAVAEELLKTGSALDSSSRGHTDELFGDVEGAISVPEYFDRVQKSFSEFSTAPRFEDAAYSVLQGSDTNVPNPELLLNTARLQQEIYAKFETFITAPNEEKGNIFNEIRRSSERYIFFNLKSSDNAQELPSSRTQLVQEVRGRREKLDITKQESKDQFKSAVDDEQSLRDYASLREEQPDAVRRIERFQEQSQFTEETLPELDLYPMGLKRDEQLEVRDGMVEFEGYQTEKDAIDQEVAQKKLEVQQIQTAIDEVNARAKTEGNGMLGGKRKQREKELEELGLKRTQKDTELAAVAEKNQTLAAKDSRLRAVRSIIQKINKEGFTVELPATGSAQEVLDRLKEALGQLNLTEEDNALKQKLEVRKEKSDSVQRRREQAMRGY